MYLHSKYYQIPTNEDDVDSKSQDEIMVSDEKEEK